MILIFVRTGFRMTGSGNFKYLWLDLQRHAHKGLHYDYIQRFLFLAYEIAFFGFLHSTVMSMESPLLSGATAVMLCLPLSNFQ